MVGIGGIIVGDTVLICQIKHLFSFCSVDASFLVEGKPHGPEAEQRCLDLQVLKQSFFHVGAPDLVYCLVLYHDFHRILRKNPFLGLFRHSDACMLDEVWGG
ncbi:hypothetical protein SDC9_195472 [bioreactor metagenome]|uniref:Uncharacterized protein n=1 Tax=bioreactor metagenome TaxID=1076179 RepID=A0A645I9E1_9ZZZZ